MKGKFFLILTLLFLFVPVTASLSQAALIYEFEGNITSISDNAGAADGIQEGDAIQYTFSIDFDQPGFYTSMDGNKHSYVDPDGRDYF